MEDRKWGYSKKKRKKVRTFRRAQEGSWMQSDFLPHPRALGTSALTWFVTGPGPDANQTPAMWAILL